MEEFTFANSNAVEYPVYIKIVRLEGQHDPPTFSVSLQRPDLKYIGSNTSANSDLQATFQMWADSKPLTRPVQTSYKHFQGARFWDEWLKLPVNICQLPQTAQIAITVWDVVPGCEPTSKSHVVAFGGTTLALFDDEAKLKSGRQQCILHRGKAADGLSSSATPSTVATHRPRDANGHPETHILSAEEDELERLERLLKKHEGGEIAKVDWLDGMVVKLIDQKRRELKTSIKDLRRARMRQFDATVNGNATPIDQSAGEDVSQERFLLFVDLPRFDFPIVFTDHEYTPTPVSSLSASAAAINGVNLRPPPEVRFGPGINAAGNNNGDGGQVGPLIRVYDPEVGIKENPAESKHRRLVRSSRTATLDRDIKPNAKIRDELNTIISYGPSQDLNAEEKDLVWRFRHHLTRDKRALTKFIKSVSWQEPSEARQAVQLLPKWTKIDVDDALELLGPSFHDSAVRAYAVDRLRESDDDELLMYLLQLVQALKFEKISLEDEQTSSEGSPLAEFLVSRATDSLVLGNYLHWYLMVECDDRSPEQPRETRKLFAKVEYDFMTALAETAEGAERRRVLLRQGELIAVLSKISKDVRFSREDRLRKISRLKKSLADPKNDLVTLDPPLPLPLDPSVMVTGMVPDESLVFKSSLFPLLLHFKTASGAQYPIIFKTGDDLRQDQLVIQIISLMDRLLRKENLDLRLTPYKILATSATAGAVQFIPSTSLAAASAKYRGSILAYLRDHADNADPAAELGVRREVMDTYVKSCAGYCVITYLLGVGDRHLDNLLLAPDGHFFHADFGYILGRDPKPFAPQMKLCKEMVEGMGGSGSTYYKQFKSYCFTAYTTLRKSSNLILNLFALMVDANITDIRLMNREASLAGQGGAGGVAAGAAAGTGAILGAAARAGAAATSPGASAAVEKVRERFHLELTEEEAIRHFEGLIADSVGAIFPVVIDTIHNMMQGLRA